MQENLSEKLINIWKKNQAYFDVKVLEFLLEKYQENPKKFEEVVINVSAL